MKAINRSLCAWLRVFSSRLLGALFLLLQSIGLVPCASFAQDTPVYSMPPVAAASQPVEANPIPSSLLWSQLSAEKQQSLLPLQAIWPRLGEAHKRKWLTVAQNFPKMQVQDQEKLHSRMENWAALEPKARELARLNFSETKKLTPEKRAANWEAYQALSPEERQVLTDKALSKKSKSAAISIKPSIKQKFIAIPPRRIAPESLSALIMRQEPVHSNTLLPQRQPQ